MRTLSFLTVLIFGWVFVALADVPPKAAPSRATALTRAITQATPAVVGITTVTAGGREERGAGIVIDPAGYLVAPRHIVEDRTPITVQLADDSEWTARLLLADAASEIAVLRIDVGRKLPALTLASSADLLPGEPAYILAHPRGYRHSVTSGVISATGREITMPSGTLLRNLIQTDAAISLGSSGGALLNSHGECVGMVIAMRGDAQGVGFAIPSDAIKDLLAAPKFSALRNRKD